MTDHLGTPREMFGEAGDLLWAAEYRTWGAVRRLWVSDADNDNRAASRGSAFPGGGGGRGGRTFGALALKDDPAAIEAAQICPIRFQGQYEDAETGLSYNTFRHYDALAGRYAGPDPIGLIGGYRPHGYVSQPATRFDPFGLGPRQPELFPREPYNRGQQYGTTPNAAQKGSVPQGMEFDHDPPLVEHYYEGDGKGGTPGYNMTDEERKAYGKSLCCGKAASPGDQRRQGAEAAKYSKMMKRRWFGM